VAVSYLINRLQPLPFTTPVVVTLNPLREPAPRDVIAEFDVRASDLRRPGDRRAARTARRHRRRRSHLVLRRLGRLRLPRGRPANRRSRVANALGCFAPWQGGAGTPGRRALLSHWRRCEHLLPAKAHRLCFGDGDAPRGCGRRCTAFPTRCSSCAAAGPVWIARRNALSRSIRLGLFELPPRDHGARDGSHALPWIHADCSPARASTAPTARSGCRPFRACFGYVFNPVSFWYCHDRAGGLRAVLAEVNNTFGERHNYLLHHADLRPIVAGDELRARKVFHVSPFFPVARRVPLPLRAARRGACGAIELLGRRRRAELLHTACPAVRSRSRRQHGEVARFASPGMTLGVVARIHWQALRLWLRRVPFFRKPAPPLEETTPDERTRPPPCSRSPACRLARLPRATRLCLEMLDRLDGGAIAVELPDGVALARFGHGAPRPPARARPCRLRRGAGARRHRLRREPGWTACGRPRPPRPAAPALGQPRPPGSAPIYGSACSAC
jgi:DUF1365 family protein